MDDLNLSTLIWLRMARFVQNSNQLSNEHLRQFGLTRRPIRSSRPYPQLLGDRSPSPPSPKG